MTDADQAPPEGMKPGAVVNWCPVHNGPLSDHVGDYCPATAPPEGEHRAVLEEMVAILDENLRVGFLVGPSERHKAALTWALATLRVAAPAPPAAGGLDGVASLLCESRRHGGARPCAFCRMQVAAAVEAARPAPLLPCPNCGGPITRTRNDVAEWDHCHSCGEDVRRVYFEGPTPRDPAGGKT
jgi:hypothetical protein